MIDVFAKKKKKRFKFKDTKINTASGKKKVKFCALLMLPGFESLDQFNANVETLLYNQF